MKKTVLVTGGAGFIGSNFVRYWHETHPLDTLIIIDALTYAGNKESLSPLLSYKNVHFHHGDVTNEPYVAHVFSAHAISHVVHFAAESHVDRSIRNPDIFLKTNVIGTHVLLKKSLEKWQKSYNLDPHLCRFHHVSTDEVFGTLAAPTDAPFSECTAYAPRSPYAASKAAADHLVQSYSHTYGLPITLSYCSNNYGPRQHPEKLLPLLILNVLLGKPLPIYGAGHNQREWLHVLDHCRAIDFILKNGKPGQTFAIGSGEEAKNIDLAHKLCAIIDAKFKTDPGLQARFPKAPPASNDPADTLITFVQDRPGHDFRYALNNNKLKDLGFELSYQINEGLEATVDWYLTNQKWVQAVIQHNDYTQWLAKNYSLRAAATT